MAVVSTVRVGLIGAGRFTRMAHVPALRTHAGARVTAVCDINPDALASVADAFGVDGAALYAEADELIQSGQVDAVIVSTPNALHYPQARAALDRGLHALVDKPLVLRTGDALDLRDRAAARGLVLMVGYNRHYDPASLYLREQIRRGALGEVRLVRALQRGLSLVDVPWYRDVALAGGRMLTLRGTHMADLIPWLTGAEVASVSAAIRWVDEPRGIDGDTVALLRLANGTLAELICLEEDADGNLDEVHVFGSAGRLVLARPPDSRAWRVLNPSGSALPDNALPDGGNLTHNFIDGILGAAENRSPATDGVAAVRLIEVIYESARCGGPVFLWPDGGL